MSLHFQTIPRSNSLTTNLCRILISSVSLLLNESISLEPAMNNRKLWWLLLSFLFWYETPIDFIPYADACAPTHLSVSLTQRTFSIRRFLLKNTIELEFIYCKLTAIYSSFRLKCQWNESLYHTLKYYSICFMNWAALVTPVARMNALCFSLHSRTYLVDIQVVNVPILRCTHKKWRFEISMYAWLTIIQI